jgi:hypothetical protein
LDWWPLPVLGYPTGGSPFSLSWLTIWIFS